MGFNEAPQDHWGFFSLLLQRISWKKLNEIGTLKQRGRSPYKLSAAQLLVGILFHYTITGAGTLGEHLMILLGMKMAESTLSERRQALPFEVFEKLLGLVLRPLAATRSHASYRGLGLMAIDGVSFSLPNTDQVNGRCSKGRNQKAQAPFAKLQCAVLVELLMHNPLAARLGRHGESEWKLAQELLGHLPPNCLLLTDRLYGCGAFLLCAKEKLSQRNGHFLARVKESLKVVRQLRPLKDGSQVVEIKALDPKNHHRVVGTLEVREIRATVKRRGFAAVKVRFWTDLMDCEQYPAQELVSLYMKRWEEELYFRELKRELGVNNLLRSQTVETAAQEVAAMIIGSSLIAHERALLKPGEELSHRISFIKVWETLEPLWLTLLLGADILSEKQKQQLADRFYWLASTKKMAQKRIRVCPRVLCQPAQAWPKKRNQKSSTAPLKISLCATPS